MGGTSESAVSVLFYVT